MSIPKTIEVRQSVLDQLMNQLGLLVFLVMLMAGIVAEGSIWTTLYRSFVVWVVFTILGAILRVMFNYRQLESEHLRLKKRMEEIQELKRKKLERLKASREQLKLKYEEESSDKSDNPNNKNQEAIAADSNEEMR